MIPSGIFKGIVYVKNSATLTIEPGTFVVGQPGTSRLRP